MTLVSRKKKSKSTYRAGQSWADRKARGRPIIHLSLPEDAVAYIDAEVERRGGREKGVSRTTIILEAMNSYRESRTGDPGE